MRKLFLGCTALVTLFLFFAFKPGGKEHDKQLVGIWKGFEKDKQLVGVEKHWILERFDNGKYVIMFTTKQDCEVETFSENGDWWTKDGKYYEKNKVNDGIETYNYEVKDKIVIDFKSEKKDGYSFTDYKIDLD